MVLRNLKEDKKVEKELWKYNLENERSEQVQILEDIDMPIAPDGSLMFAAQVVFSTQKTEDFKETHGAIKKLKSNFANVYYRTFEDTEQEQHVTNDEK